MRQFAAMPEFGPGLLVSDLAAYYRSYAAVNDRHG
jgi:hypothetical protein